MLTASVCGPFRLDSENRELVAENSSFISPANLLVNHGIRTPITSADEARRQALRESVLLASSLISKIELMNYMYAVDALQSMHPAQRLTIARTMLGINKQHRRILASLPVLSISVLRVNDREFLYHIQITYATSAAPQVFSFTFDPEELNSVMKAAG